jgi:hypothetical protein
MNTRHPRRPKGYQPPADLVRKVEEARKDPKIDVRIKTALERWAARQPQSTGKLRIDDGNPPADGNTFAVTVNISITTLNNVRVCVQEELKD